MAMASDVEQKLLDVKVVKTLAVNAREVADQRHDRYSHGYVVKGWTPLHYACLNGHLDVVSYLLKNEKFNVNAKDEEGRTALHFACGNGHLNVVKFLLLNSRVDVNAISTIGWTPLHFACEKNKIEVVQCLLVNVELSVYTANYVLRWTCRCGYMEALKFVLSSTKSDVNAVDKNYQRNPLHLASMNGHLEVVEFLLVNSNCDVNAKDRTGMTPLHYAYQEDHMKVVQHLENNSQTDINAKDNYGHIPKDYAQTKMYNDSQPETGGQQLLSIDELRILKIVLADHMIKLEENGLSIERAISDKLDITKASVVDCLRTIDQSDMADNLAKRRGVKELQEFVFTNIYEEALKNEQYEVSLHVFKMILCGVPRSGKTTFWKRFVQLKDFIPSETSPSTAAFESHFISANEKEDTNMNTQNKSEGEEIESTSLPHLEAKMLLDLRLYDDTSDLKNEALTIYRHIIMTNDPMLMTVNSTQQSITEIPSAEFSDEDDLMTESDGQTDAPSEEQPVSDSIQVSITSEVDDSELEIKTSIPQKQLSVILERSLFPSLSVKDRDPISAEINKYFEELKALLKSGEKIPDIQLIRKLCNLIDIGGQRAFLEMLPTVTVGKALYLLFFSYENFEKQVNETVQKHGNSNEICTGTIYRQLEVIMQSLICVSTTTKTTSNNVALLVGTHVDKVEPHYVDHVNGIVFDSVKSFLGSTLVYAERSPRGKDKLVLEVSIEPNKRCSNNPEDYQKVIMNLVEKRLKCSESEKLPASWYMFSILLRRIQYAGHSVIQYRHCQQIANKLYIKSNHLQGLLSRMHRILGIILYFPEVEELKDIVICDPEAVYKGISDLIFNSYDVTTHPVLALRLKRWGVFVVSELKERSKEEEGSQLALDKLIILLQHTGVIAPVNVVASDTVPSVKPAEGSGCIKSQYVIPCILDDALPADMKVQIEEAQACSIVPVRIYFECGFAPMGGFCYLFTKLITNNHDKGWQLLLPDIFNEKSRSKNDIYWRNKVTFKVDEKYFVTLISTSEYYEIHIVHTGSGKPFQLGKEGHYICRKVWNTVSKILSSSLNESQQKYKTAYKCIKHQNIESDIEHVMTFIHNPDDNEDEITAVCCRDNSLVTVDQKKQSIAVWFKEPHDHRIAEIGEDIQLSVDTMLIVKSPNEIFTYEWQTPNGRKIRKVDKRFKDSNTSILKIVTFEYKYRGAYKCVISTAREPKVSLSTEVSVDFQNPPKTFDPEMSDDDFLLFLNMYGIPYEVCCTLLIDNDITAQRFNLSTFEYWSQQLEIRDMEKADLRQLITMCTPHHGLGVSHNLPTTAELSWPPLSEQQQNEITGYTVLAVGPDSTQEQTYTVDKTASLCEITGLRPSTSYTFRVFARSISKTGPAATISSTTPKGELTRLALTDATIQATDVRCPVCLHIQVDPCTLQCGHSICQLCLARLWKREEKYCPVCKEIWKVFPAISINYRTSIESSYCHEVDELRMQYTAKDKEILKEYLAAKEEFYQKAETLEKQNLPKDKASIIDTVPLQAFAKDLDDEQLALWLSNHPHLVGIECQDDIHKLRGAKIGGSRFLNLDKASLQEFDVSPGFQSQLMKIIKDLTKEQSSDIKVQRHLSEQVSPSGTVAAQQRPIVDEQQIPIAIAEIEETDTTLSDQPIKHDNFSDGVQQQQPQLAIVMDQPQVKIHPQPRIFSKDMNNEQLALWLSNHPDLIGTDYQSDIDKLKGARINGSGFLHLTENRLDQFGVSIGFLLPLMSIIRDLQRSLQPSPTQRLLPQPQFTGLQQTQHEPKRTLATQVGAYPQPLIFSKGMNNEQLALWLANHPSLIGTDYQEDIEKLKGAKINGHGFLSLNESRLERFGVSFGFQIPCLHIIEELKGDQQYSDSKGLPSYVQQQPQTTSVATPQAVRSYPTPSTARQQNKLGPKQTLATQVGAYPQPSIFSKGMNNEQLALWLTNHPSLIGTDYQEDIEKLKGAKINGHGFLSLNESRLERFGVSFGFQIPCLHIIEELKGDQQYSDSKGLPSYVQQQPQTTSLATPQAVRSYPTTPTARQQNKLDQLPTLDELMILKYEDKGEKKRIRIISEASHRWKDITSLICGNANTTAILGQRCHDDPNECLRQSFINNFISKKPQGYSQNWSGLVELLEDVDLETLAEKVKHALSCT